MKMALVLCACTLVLCSAAGFALAPSEAAFNLVSILSQPALSGSCPTPRSEVLFAAPGKEVGGFKAFCEASCGIDGTVSCSGTTCSATNRSCPSEQGHVTCDGNTTWCPTCPSCSGAFCCACVNTGACFACCRCDGGTAFECSQECS